MDDLIALQRLQFDEPARTEAAAAEIEKLRKRVPAPILAHFERLGARGKKGVAVVRNGVCGGCHMRQTSAKLIALASVNDVHLCDSCGRYLYLAEGENITLGEPKLTAIKPATPVKRRPRKTAAHAL